MSIEPLGLVAICVCDTPDNERWRTTVRCLSSFSITTDFSSHELIIIDNGSTCPNTRAFLDEFCQDLVGVRHENVTLVRFSENQYATAAFNHVIHTFAARFPSRVFVRVENDLEMRTPQWLDRMIRIFEADPQAGVISTRPLDLPRDDSGGVQVTLAGYDCLLVDEVPGFCTAFRPGVLAGLGTLVSAGRYIEDVITGVRLKRLGWKAYFAQPGVISCYHVDRCPNSPYQQWKRETAGSEWARYLELREGFESGREEVYVPYLRRDVEVGYPFVSEALRAAAGAGGGSAV